MENLKNIDRWAIEKFDPAWNPTGMLEVSSFCRLYPPYREKYLQESWPRVESALKEYGIACKLNLVEGNMTVSTTTETRDPYIIIKARDMLRLLSRSFPAPQAIKILKDEMHSDIININIRYLVRKEQQRFVKRRQPPLLCPKSSTLKKWFVKRRQRLLGPYSSTLKTLKLVTKCYIVVQGSTVAAMGSYRDVNKVRRVVEDCMQNKLHPLYNINILMVNKKQGLGRRLMKEEELELANGMNRGLVERNIYSHFDSRNPSRLFYFRRR